MLKTTPRMGQSGQLRSLLDALQEPYLIADRETGGIVMANRLALDLVGYTSCELLKLRLEQLIPSWSLDCEAPADSSSSFAGRALNLQDKEGRLIPISLRLAFLAIQSREHVVLNVQRVGGGLLDRTSKAPSEKLARQLFLNNVAGAFLVTLDGELLECNKALVSMLGYSCPEELQRLSARSLYVTPDSRDSWLAELRRKGVAINYEFQMMRKDGTVIWALENSILVTDPASGRPAAIGTVIDLTEHKRRQLELEELAHRDYLTQLPNRRLLDERSKQFLALARRRRGRAALICCDLRHFKQINDSMGHKTGDQVLLQVAERLTTNSRTEDTVVRLGGDEFAVFLPRIKDEEDVLHSAQRLAGCLEEPFAVDGKSLHLDASFGVAVFPEDGEDLDSLLECADQALYGTARCEPRAIQLFSSLYSGERASLREQQDQFCRAVANQELSLVYQPIRCLQTGTVAGAEGFVRWHDPERGLQSTSDFIPMAEYSGLISELDHWVLKAAIDDIGGLDRSRRPGWVSLNFSAGSLAHPEFVPKILAALQAGAFAPSQLVVEISEKLPLRDLHPLQPRIDSLRRAGAGLAIDDFGAGNSSLSLLVEWQPDFVKLDASLISNVLGDEKNGALVLGIIGLAHKLGFKLIAEGVETEEQEEWLSAVECDYAQGWWTGRPSSAIETFRPSRGWWPEGSRQTLTDCL